VFVFQNHLIITYFDNNDALDSCWIEFLVNLQTFCVREKVEKS